MDQGPGQALPPLCLWCFLWRLVISFQLPGPGGPSPPEGFWRLSWQIPGIHRGLPKGRSLWIRDQAELYRLSVYGASSDFSKSPSNCQALVARPRQKVPGG